MVMIMTNPIKYTKPLIDLAGKLDFAIRKGNADRANDVIKQMRTKLNQIQKFIKDHEAV